MDSALIEVSRTILRRFDMRLKALRFSCAVAGLLLSAFISTAAYSADVIKLRYAMWMPPTHKMSVVVDQWCKEVEKRTEGRVKITPYFGGTLAAPQLVYDGLLKEAFDLGQTALAYNTGRFPFSEILDYPLGYRDARQATALDTAFTAKFKPQLKEFEDVKMLYFFAPGATLIHTRKVISSVEDIKGMRIKGSGLNLKALEALGAVPSTVTMAETYDALQKGMLDGVLQFTETLQTFRFGEVLKCTVTDHGISTAPVQYVAMNKKKWESLPKDIQLIIEKINEEWIQKTVDELMVMDKEAYEFLKKQGHTIVAVSKEQEAKTAEKMKPVLDLYVQAMKAKNLPGDEALKFCLDFLKSH
jgi:TRAP-type C4-dicarboxylate transport system substrate-binding protein